MRAKYMQSWHTLPLKHVVESQQFDRSALDVIFSTGQVTFQTQHDALLDILSS